MKVLRGRTDLDDMDETSENSGQAFGSALLRALRPAMPAVIGAAALTFLFAALMPFSWVAGIGWNLYLDRLSDFFVPPVGNAARLVLAFGMAGVAAVLAGLIALLIAQPDAAGLSSLRRRFSRTSDTDVDADSGETLTRRRRVDLHPDDPPRPPIRAGRDLPAGGLGPLTATASDESGEVDLLLGESDAYDTDELMLADLAPMATTDLVDTGDEPWLQPAEMAAPPVPDPATREPTDNSLGAMVARFEAGLARRRQNSALPGNDDGRLDGEPEPEVDLALEAALSTLQRMTRQSVG